jgi:hypothetical protein
MAEQGPCATDQSRRSEAEPRRTDDGVERATTPRARGRPRKWDEAKLRSELAVFLATWPHRHFPTLRQLRAIGQGPLARAVSVHGGFNRWAAETGYAIAPRSDRQPYNWDDARRDVARVIEEWGVLPGGQRLRNAGYQRLATFLQDTAGNRHQLLAGLGYDEAAIARYADSRRVRRKLHWTHARIEREARALLKNRDEWPPDTFFVQARAAALLTAIRRYGGRELWAQRLGLRYRGRERRRG